MEVLHKLILYLVGLIEFDIHFNLAFSIIKLRFDG